MITPLQSLQSLLPALVPEERRGRPGPARAAALEAAEANPDQRAAYLLVAVYACLAAGEAREALRIIDAIHSQDDAIARRLRACRAWARQLERNWYPGDTGAEMRPGQEMEPLSVGEFSADDPESAVVEACPAFGPGTLLTLRSILDLLMIRNPAAADPIVGEALQSLARFDVLAEGAGAVSSALWAQMAMTDIARRAGRLADARGALSTVRSVYEAAGDPVGVALTWLLEGDWFATPGATPESLGIRLADEGVPLFSTERDDAAAAQAYELAWTLLDGVDAPRARGALELRLALLDGRAGRRGGQRDHLEAARRAFAEAGDAAGEHLATVHSWLAAIGRGEFVEIRAIAPLEWGALHGPVKALADWATSSGSPSYCSGLGRLLQREGQQWAAAGEFERAEISYRLARGLISLNGAVPSWTIPEALAQLDDKRSFQTRSLVRWLQILTHLPPATSPSRDASAWLQDVYFTTGLLRTPTGVTGTGALAIRLIERASERLRRLLELAGIADSRNHSLPRDPAAALRAAGAADAADPSAFLQRLAAGDTAETESLIVQCGAAAARKSLAGARPLGALLTARLAQRQGWDSQADVLFRSAVEQSRQAAEDGAWIGVLALNAWGKRQEAIEAFQEVLRSRWLSETLLAPLALRAGDFRRARELFEAWPAPATTAPGQAWRDLADRAEAALECGDAASAMLLAERGVGDFEQGLAQLFRDTDRLDACDDISAAGLYQLVARARLRQATSTEAAGDASATNEYRDSGFGILDRHRTLALPVDLSADPAAAATPATRRWQQATTDHTTAYQRLLAALVFHPDAEATAADALAEAERALAEIEAAFTPDEHAAVRRARRPRTCRAKEIQDLLPAETCLLEYQVVGRDLVGFGLTRTDMRAHEAHLDYRLDGLASRLLRACAAGTVAEIEADQLSRALLEPFADLLNRSNRVLVVPASVLTTVPFHVLPFAGEALGATRILSYLPAAAMLVRGGGVDRPLAKGSTLVIGDPAFDPANHPKLRRLAGAAVEAKAVGRIHDSTAVFTDSEAREPVLRPLLAGQALLHVAAHGRLDEIAPNTSSIILAGRDELTVSDLIGLHLSTDLAVLSACDTGRGTTTLGGDLIGLTRGLLAAGVRRCIVSLWPVDDVAACVTMVALHRRLKQGAPPAGALAEAQREIRGLSGLEIAERYRALGGTLAPGQRALRRKSQGIPRQLSAFPEVDEEDAETPVEALDGHLTSIWAPFVLIGT